MLHPYCPVMKGKIGSIYEEARDQIMLHYKSPHAQALIGCGTRGGPGACAPPLHDSLSIDPYNCGRNVTYPLCPPVTAVFLRHWYY